MQPGPRAARGTRGSCTGAGECQCQVPELRKNIPSLWTPGLLRPPAWRWRMWKWEDGDGVEGEGSGWAVAAPRGDKDRGHSQTKQQRAQSGAVLGPYGQSRCARRSRKAWGALRGEIGRSQPGKAPREPGLSPWGAAGWPGTGWLGLSLPPSRAPAPSPGWQHLCLHLQPCQEQPCRAPPPRHGPGPLPITVAVGQGTELPGQLAVGGGKPPRTIT